MSDPHSRGKFPTYSDQELAYASEVVRQLCDDGEIPKDAYEAISWEVADRLDVHLGRRAIPAKDYIRLTKQGSLTFTDRTDGLK